ncbi:MAG TPA: CRISPR-associated endonuclease Cas3'' [Trebonia sp.]|nr:CRISPR-associated endonuclease Cas3'' [Trebonia sp.]
MQTFGELFRRAANAEPDGYLERIARDGLPDAVRAPAGAGAAGLILAWLWRRLHGPDPARTPRRLIYALPQRSLTEPVSGQARRWLANLGLTDEVTLHVALGARWESVGEWRDDPHKPAIVIGTVDVLGSKALNRALGLSRAIFPIDFALVTNGAHWIIEEPELCPQATATLRRLAGFAARLGTAEPFGLTGLSTGSRNPIQILDIERTGALSTRLRSLRAVRRLPAGSGDYQAIAAEVLARHRPDALTLVVMNTVDAAQHLYRMLRVDARDCTLLHSRFRGIERDGRLAAAIGEPGPSGGRIVVATQVVEAGLDVDAAVLVTEAAPWPSLIQRAGRCNRGGRPNADAELWWLPPPSPFPYRQQDIDATARELGRLEGVRLTAVDLTAREVPHGPGRLTAIRESDLAALFDTAPDPSGADVDIAPYLSDAEGLDAEVAWATWTPGADGAPDPEIRIPAAEYRCRVPLDGVVALARGRAVWRYDRAAGGWTRVAQQPESRPRPGEVLLVSAADGGYDPETGFDPAAPGPVPASPELLTPDERTSRAALAAAEATLAVAALANGEADPDEPDPETDPDRRWQSLDEHSEQVRDQAAALLAVLAPSLPPEAARSAVLAAYLHDLGKAHEIWQDAICALADEEDKASIEAGRPWAKSGGSGALLFAGGVAFRHELASLLLIAGPLAALLAESPDPDLTKYLILAHHGKLRVHVRERHDPATPAPATGPTPTAAPTVPGVSAEGHPPDNIIRGLRQGATTAIPALLGQPATTLTVDLDQFHPNGDSPWTRTVAGLRDRYGPFILAYLEALVRISDWRASGGRDLPTAG